MARILEHVGTYIPSYVCGIEFVFDPTEIILALDDANPIITQNPSDDDMKKMKDRYQLIIHQGSTGIELYDTGVCINLIGNRLYFTSKNIANQKVYLPDIMSKKYHSSASWFIDAYKFQDEPLCDDKSQAETKDI